MKPFDNAELLVRIEAVLRRYQKSKMCDTVLRFKDLTLNTDTLEVKIKDVPISLTKYEYLILQLLMSAPHKVFTKNNIFQKFEVLKTNRNKRYRYHEFFVEGVRSLNEAVRNNWKIKSFVYDKNNLSDWAKDMINKVNTDMNYCLTPELMKELSGKEDTSELMAVIEMREDELEQVTLSEKPFIVLFDRPSNRGNLGTMIRSCDALGVDMLIITGHAVDLYDTDVVVSAMGSFFKLPVIRISDNKALFEYIDKLKKDILILLQ